MSAFDSAAGWLSMEFLLASGIGLAVMIQQYPLVHGWLTVKLFLKLGAAISLQLRCR
jgi:uncharacterized membrane protein SirB2